MTTKSLLLAAALAMALPTAALADGWHGGDWHHHPEWHGGWGPRAYVYAPPPPVYYAPPPVVYAPPPPPPVIYAPPPVAYAPPPVVFALPSLMLGINLR